jgi:hypothetical protein
MDTIEATLARLTARTEEVELRLNRVVSDGTNRIGDIEYRVCELTEGCDPATLAATPTLGGDTGGSGRPGGDGSRRCGAGGTELAVANRKTLTGPRGCSVRVTFAVLQSSLRPMPNPILADR